MPSTASSTVRRLRVVVDMTRLRSNLSHAEHRPMSTFETEQFLMDAGFVRDGDGWIGGPGELGHLTPDEVLNVDVIEPGRQQLGGG